MRSRHSRSHLSRELLESLARGEEDVEEVLSRGLAHLTTRCPECRQRLREYPLERILEGTGAAYDAGITRAKERVADLAREREEAPERVRDLLSEGDVPRVLAALAAVPRYQTWGLTTYLLERAEAGLEDAPREAYTTSLLASAAAEGLPKERYGSGVVATARVVAGAILATARVQREEDAAGAEGTLSRASLLAPAASDWTLVRAELALARMAIDLATGEWERPVRAFGQVELQAREGNLPGHRLRGLLYLGRAHRAAGERHRALSTFRVLALQAGRQAPYPHLSRWGTLEAARTFSELGRPEAALAELEKLPAASVSREEPRGPAVREWLRGRALWRLRRPTEAAPALEVAWRALLGCGSVREAVAALLDLVELHLEEGRGVEGEALLDRTRLLHGAGDVPQTLVAALFRLRRAAARGEADPAEVAAVRDRLARSRTLHPAHGERVH